MEIQLLEAVALGSSGYPKGARVKTRPSLGNFLIRSSRAVEVLPDGTVRRPRGRPRMTDAEKAERAAQRKARKRTQLDGKG